MYEDINNNNPCDYIFRGNNLLQLSITLRYTIRRNNNRFWQERYNRLTRSSERDWYSCNIGRKFSTKNCQYRSNSHRQRREQGSRSQQGGNYLHRQYRGTGHEGGHWNDEGSPTVFQNCERGGEQGTGRKCVWQNKKKNRRNLFILHPLSHT